MQILLASAKIMPAVLAYYGQAYKHLRADLMTAEDLLWADGKVHHREPDNGAGQAEGFQLRRVQLQ